MTKKIKELYATYPNQPYISSERHLEEDDSHLKPVPRRNMESLDDNLLAGDIILLWRVAFGTFTTESVFPKYLEFTYGINGKKHLESLLDKSYIYLETAFGSLTLITSSHKKTLLKSKGITGLSKLKRSELDLVLKETVTEEELAAFFSARVYGLTAKGKETLALHQAIVDRHPKKKF